MTTNARLRALVELADAGSVHGAAERLVVSESAISSAISGLSAEVGVPLVDRHGRGIRLTPAGHRYVEYARRILGLHDEALLAARGEADPENGSIRLAASSRFSTCWKEASGERRTTCESRPNSSPWPTRRMSGHKGTI